MEDSYLLRPFDVFTDARAGIVITDPDDPDRLSGLVRQAAQVELHPGLFSRQELLAHFRVALDNLVDPRFDLPHLVRRQATIEMVCTNDTHQTRHCFSASTVLVLREAVWCVPSADAVSSTQYATPCRIG